MFYPCNYGFMPQTLSDDGDPVDVLVVGRRAGNRFCYSGCRASWRVENDRRKRWRRKNRGCAARED